MGSLRSNVRIICFHYCSKRDLIIISSKYTTYFILLLILLQMLDNIIFGLLINNYKDNRLFINIFKLCAKEIGYKILVVDALMHISIVVIEK